MTKEELIKALEEADDRIREYNRWEYDTIKNAEANGARMALEHLRAALENPRKNSDDE